VRRRKTRGPGEISIQPGSGFDKGHKCSCWPKPDDARPCTPQTCDWRCRACRIHGQPFYSHGDLLYLEHGTGPQGAELERLWRGKGTMKGGTARDAARHLDRLPLPDPSRIALVAAWLSASATSSAAWLVTPAGTPTRLAAARRESGRRGRQGKLHGTPFRLRRGLPPGDSP
jgi:hypothetical protein